MGGTRVQAIHDWLQHIDGMAGATLSLASADASFRRYWRVCNNDICRIVMDAPPDKENSEPFLRIASWLRSMNLNAPQVFEADLKQGFLLLTDLGATHYLDVLRRAPENSDQLYADAIDALITMQREGVPYQAGLPAFGEEVMRAELALFSDWLCRAHLGIEFSLCDSQEWQATCDFLVDNALGQPQVFIHCDYHSRNLMLVDRRDPHGNPGILDFQDAALGPYTYDLVSLLKDCYIDWPAQKVNAWAKRFYAERRNELGAPLGFDLFQQQFELMGVQRHLKAAGIFARLNHRDQKPAYLLDVPRTLNYVLETEAKYTQLTFLRQLISERILPGLRQPPT